MAESTQRLSDKLKAQHQIPWSEISGFRNILVHDYLGDIDAHIIWITIENHLPELYKAMKEALKNL